MAMNERTLNGFIAAAMQRQAPPNYRFAAEQSGTARRGNATPDIVVEMPYGLRAVKDAVSQYIQAGVSATTNIAAEIWQSLIPDRDQRAAYYTKPSTAELLANITTRRLSDPHGAKYNEVCAGTGTLARATEENIRFRHYAQSDDQPFTSNKIEWMGKRTTGTAIRAKGLTFGANMCRTYVAYPTMPKSTAVSAME